jgi:hypothetical protein
MPTTLTFNMSSPRRHRFVCDCGHKGELEAPPSRGAKLVCIQCGGYMTEAGFGAGDRAAFASELAKAEAKPEGVKP